MLDVQSADSVADLLQSLKASPPTILVNNAGITRDNLLIRMKDEEWDSNHQTQPDGSLPAVQGLPARHDEGTRWPHHQYRLGGRQRRATPARPTMRPPRPA